MTTPPLTRSSVLERARDGDATDFVGIYAPLIYRLARRAGLRDQDAEDLMQTIILELIQKMPGFHYDRSKGRFKGLLQSIVGRRVIDVFRREARTSASPEGLEEVPDPSSMLETDFEREWMKAHLLTALDRVRTEVKPTTFQAFELLVLRGWPVDRVAKALGQTPNRLSQNKRRVIQRLRTHLEDLLDDENG